MQIENFQKKIKGHIADGELHTAFFYLKKEVNSFSPSYHKIRALDKITDKLLQNEDANRHKIQNIIFEVFDVLDELKDSDLKRNTPIWKRVMRFFKRKKFVLNNDNTTTIFNPSEIRSETIKEKMNGGDDEDESNDFIVKPSNPSSNDEAKEDMGADEEEETIEEEKKKSKGWIGSFIDRLNDIFIKSNKGKIVCSIPREFQFNRVNNVIIRLSREDLADSVLESGLEDTNLEKGKVELGKVMVVEIFEPSNQNNFEITSLNNPEQVIDLNKDEFKEWIYQVKALKKGFHSLIIRVSIVKKVAGMGEKKDDLIVWCKEVKVSIGDTNDGMDTITLGRSWNPQHATKLKMKIAKNELGVVFQDLANILQFQDVVLFNRLVGLQARWHQIHNDNREGLLEHDEFSADKIGIGKALLIIIDLLDSNGNIAKITDLEAQLTHLEGLVAA